MRVLAALCLLPLLLLASKTLLSDAATPSCPARCHCLNDKAGKNERWHVTCKWDRIPLLDVLSAFPVNVTSLTIQCSDNMATSHYSSGMFTSLRGQLWNLTISNCRPADSSSSPVVITRNMPSLRYLQLDHLGEWKPTDDDSLLLNDSSALERLVLSSNGLEKMPSLCHLTELKLLNLSSNRLSSLHWLSACSRKLVTLDVSRNRIASIGRHQLKAVKSLRVLVAAHNMLQAIGDDAFDDVVHLRELRLAANLLTTVASLPFQLEQLDLSANWLPSVPSVIGRMAHLQYLNLSDNRLEQFHFDCLRESASTVKVLDLSRNRLSLIGLANSLTTGEMKLSSLEVLLVVNNRLERFDLKGVEFPALKKLDLSGNHFPDVRFSHLKGMPNLRSLKISDSSVGSVEEDAFVGSTQVKELCLAGNFLVQVPKVIRMLTNLTNLDLSGNRIEAIPKFLFDNLPAMSGLNLANNHIVAIDRYVFTSVPNLVELNLANNAISQLSVNCFDGLTNLRRLHLQGNNIGDLQGVLSNLDRLDYVNVSGNWISSLNLKILPSSLSHLDASRNRISKVTNFLHGLNKETWLRQADFSFNNIQQLSADSVADTLRLVNFSHNSIERVQARSFFNCTQLSSVDLRYNKLRTIEASALQLRSTNLTASTASLVYLSNNPFQCDCYIGWLSGSLDDHMRNDDQGVRSLVAADREELFCTPTALKNAEKSIIISKAPVEAFVCAYDHFCMVDCPCCEFDSCDCNSVCPADCSCYHDATLTLNKVVCSGAEVQPKNVPMLATEIRMDGVSAGGGDSRRLPRNAFLGRHRLRQLYLNSSRLSRIDEKAFNDLAALWLLDLSENELETLTGSEFYKVPKVTHLFLHKNRLATIGDYLFAQLANLRVLTLHGNRFHYLPPKIAASDAPYLRSVTLGQNPWKCDCGDKLLLQNWLPGNRALVPDHESLYCQEDLTAPASDSTVLRLLPPSKGHHFVKVNFWTFLIDLNRTFCRPKQVSASPADRSEPQQAEKEEGEDDFPVESSSRQNLVPLAVVVSGVLTVALFSVLVGYKVCKNLRRKKFYKHYVGEVGTGDSSCDNGNYSLPASLLQHDLLIYCSWEERHWVEQQLVKRLEDELPYHRLCMLYRDLFDEGLPQRRTHQRVADELIAAMERSQRVIVVLSDSFIRNEWQQTAIRIAFNHLLRDRQRNLVLILPSQLAPDMDPILAHHLRTNRCLYWNEPLFWEKLRDSVPEQFAHDLVPSESSNYADMYGTIVPSHFV